MKELEWEAGRKKEADEKEKLLKEKKKSLAETQGELINSGSNKRRKFTKGKGDLELFDTFGEKENKNADKKLSLFGGNKEQSVICHPQTDNHQGMNAGGRGDNLE